MAEGRILRVPVDLGSRSYEVLVGRGASQEVASLVPAGARRVAVVTQDGVPPTLVPELDGFETSVHRIGSGEKHKTLGTVGELCGGFARAGLSRADAVVSVGGGMVSDVAGFAAAAYHRGIAVVHVPTTLLAMIDAAVGGKTGVNLPEGKNLVGAFWQPSGVACDLASLDSLPERELRCGRGEMAKYHFIVDDDISLLDLDERIARCVAIKADIVAEDEREDGRRALLNYGHTLAHALETATNYSVAHGEAVATGIVFAAEVAREMGRIDDARVAEHRRVVGEVYGLSWSLPPGVPAATLVELMMRDKKSTGSLTFVLDSARGLETVRDVPRHCVESVLGRFRAN